MAQGVVALVRALQKLVEPFTTITGWRAFSPWNSDQWSVVGRASWGGLSARRIGSFVLVMGVIRSVGRPIQAGYEGAILPAGIPQPPSRWPLFASRIVGSLSQTLLPMGFATIGRADNLFRDRIVFSDTLGTGTENVDLLIFGFYPVV